MSSLRWAGFAVVFTLAAGALAADDPIAGIGPTGKVVKVHTAFTFTEGPAGDAAGNVYFTDVRANIVYKVDAAGRLLKFLEDSKGCNGLMFDSKGRLVACQGMAARVIAIDVQTKEITVLADQCDGKPFERPNDLVVDRTDGVYFTDPNAKSVYYLSAKGKATRVIDDLPRPNGVLLSPDEKTLYVLPSGSPDLRAYPVTAPGKVGTGKVLCKLEVGGDGLSVDTRGNLYLTQPKVGAIQVVTPEGKTLGKIAIPEGPSNCAFGGKDMKTLYVTARTSLYAAPMEATGHRFGRR